MAGIPQAFGNGPSDLNSPVPQAQGAVPEAEPTKMAQPAAPATNDAQQTPQQQPQNLFDQELEKVKNGKGTQHNPFEEMDPNLPLGYTPLTPRLRRNPAGKIEHLRNDGKWSGFSQAEEDVAGQLIQGLQHFAVRSKEDLPRVIGAIGGTLVAQRLGLGPFISAFLSGAGQAAGGVAANLADNKPTTPGGVAADVGVGAVSSLLPEGVGKIAGKLAEKYGAESTIAPLVKAGGEALQNRFMEEEAAAQAIGAKPGASLTARELETVRRMGPEAQKLYQMAWGKAAQFKEALDNVVSKSMGGYEQEMQLQGEKPNFYKVIGNVMAEHGQTITKYKALAQAESGGQTYSIDPVLSSMRDQIKTMLPKGASIFDDNGRINGRLLSEAKEKFPTLFSPAARDLTNTYQELFNVSKVGANSAEVGQFMNASAADMVLKPVGGQAESAIVGGESQALPRLAPGLTLQEMDAYRKAFGRKANFQSLSRDESNDIYAQLHHSMSTHLDDQMVTALGDKYSHEAQTLKASKEYYSSFKEMAENLQTKLESDPENAARALVDPKNPNTVKALWTMLKPKQQDYLAGGYLNTIMDPTIDEVTGKMKVISAENAWNKIDPKIKELMYGKEGRKYIDSMINYAKGINLKSPAAYNPETDGLMTKFMGLAHAVNPKGAYKFVTSLFSKNTKAQDFVTDKLKDVLLPTGADEAAKQMWLNRASKAFTSQPYKLGSKAMGADIMTEHSESNAPIEARLK